MLNSVWLILVVLLVFSARGLPLWLLVLFIAAALTTPLLREFRKKNGPDERQVFISHFSSHISFYVFQGLLLLIIVKEYVSQGINPPNQWYMLLLVPLLIKFFINLFRNYDPRQAARWIGYFFGGIWVLFVVLSHGGSLTSLIEAAPFLLLIFVAWYSGRQPLWCGIIFIALAIGSLILFRGWSGFDIYLRILMYSLIPLPVFLGGLALVTAWKGESHEVV